MDYNTPTIRAIARCLDMPREVVYLILLWCTRWQRYTLAVACGLNHNVTQLGVQDIGRPLLADYARAGNTCGLNWIGIKYLSMTELEIPVCQDDLVTVQWLVAHNWINITDGWMTYTWGVGAIKCANWMREQLLRNVRNAHLHDIDFTQPYCSKQIRMCYSIDDL
jgi:hypothetical protein